MNYDITKTIHQPFGSAIEKLTEGLAKEGFGVITKVDLKEKFREKLQVSFREYTILGACNPKLAFEAIGYDDKIGVMLPCNVLVQELSNGDTQVSAINPMHSIGSSENEGLLKIADEVSTKLKKVVDQL